MEKEMKLKSPVVFKGLLVSPSKVVTLKVSLRYDEIMTSINLLSGLNSDINIMAKIGDKKPCNLGTFTIGSIGFDKDGNATVPFKSMVENVNLVQICNMVDEEYIQLMFKALLELPDNGEVDDEAEIESEGKWVD